MTTEINIKTYETDKNGRVVNEAKRVHEIRKMGMYQFLKVSSELNKLVGTLTKDENISGALSGLVDQVEEGASVNEMIAATSSQFVKDAAGSIGLLLEVAPEKAIEIVAIMADMHKDELAFQEPLVFFDIFDAVVEINDIQAVIDRVKLSGTKLGQVMGWLKVRQEATAPKIVK